MKPQQRLYRWTAELRAGTDPSARARARNSNSNKNRKTKKPKMGITSFIVIFAHSFAVQAPLSPSVHRNYDAKPGQTKPMPSPQLVLFQDVKQT